jgi:Flp pilus assembly protein TadG
MSGEQLLMQGEERQTRMSAPLGRRRRGSALLDMAFVLPILLGLAFGVVEYGYFFFVKNSVQAAAREGARAAAVPSATLQNVVDSVSSVMTASGLNKTDYTVAVTDTSGATINMATVAAGASIKVSVQCTWGSVGVHPLPEALGGLPPTKLVKGATVMRKEG